jgi:hypothetical protein
MNKDVTTKEITPVVVKKTFWEKTKESFHVALISAGIILAILLLVWVPFKLIPSIYSHGSNFVSTSLSSLFIPSESTSTQQTAPENALITTATTSQTTNASAAKTSSAQVQQVAYYGEPDLAITLIGTGIIDPASKQFIQTNYAGMNDEVAMKFQVKNIGTNVSGAWQLRINSPSRTTPYYDSPYQQSIKPGDSMIFTASFDSPVTTGINTAYVTVDPLNMIAESSKANNQLIIPIDISGTNYAYANENNYGSVTTNTPGTLYTWTNMSVNCFANPQTSYVGSPITWYATVSGGNGYYTYSWAGSDLLSASESYTTKTYYSAGTKAAVVTVTSNGQSVTAQCMANIN